MELGGPPVSEVTRLGGVTRLSILSLILIDHVYMIGGVTHRGLPHLPEAPHLHVNKSLEEVTEKE